jgi:hypothetical protein
VRCPVDGYVGSRRRHELARHAAKR